MQREGEREGRKGGRTETEGDGAASIPANTTAFPAAGSAAVSLFLQTNYGINAFLCLPALALRSK